MQSTEIASLQFEGEEVLPDAIARHNRFLDLNSAMAVSNIEHEEIGIIVQLRGGEQVEVLTNLIDVEGDSIEVKGGHLIPIKAILRVEI